MHIEFLVEDASGAKLLEAVVPKIIGAHGTLHTWRVHPYRGIGRLPKQLIPGSQPSKRILLDQLPRLLKGYGRTPGIELVVVVVDADDRDCSIFLKELNDMLVSVDSPPTTLFRLAIEEIEAWYMGDRNALLTAYPHARRASLNAYVQDSVCGTWERLADALVKGGSAAIKREGWPAPGQLKFEWAERIGPLLDAENNLSPSFRKLRDGLRRATRCAPNAAAH